MVLQKSMYLLHLRPCNQRYRTKALPGVCEYMCFSVDGDVRQNLPLNPWNMGNEYGDTEAIK